MTKQSQKDRNTVKEIAFVAMPFSVKKTGLDAKHGPTVVDFDALWDKAFFPALKELGYMPVRADFQTGSVIIKDMLEQLIFADLVIIDISIPNGNVYYEAGIRHAIRESGCVLVSTNWASPLFDLAQIRQTRYPLNTETPSEQDYTIIKEELKKALKIKSNMESPVYSLIHQDKLRNKKSHQLRESVKEFSDFQTRIRSCRLESSDKAEELTRQLVTDYQNQKIPVYVAKELFVLVRDRLGWEASLDFYEQLDEKSSNDAMILEQIALAKSKLGDSIGAIAQLEQLNIDLGETPERLGLIAGRYRDMFFKEENPAEKPRWLNRAIACYNEGMLLDLNEHYCASNLPVLLTIRNRSTDKKEAIQIAKHVNNVCKRIRQLRKKDKWSAASELLMAFYFKDYLTAEILVDEIYNKDMPIWELTSTLRDLKRLAKFIPPSRRHRFETLIDQLAARVIVPQTKVKKFIMPRILSEGKQYRKFQTIYARTAYDGEIIVSTLGGVRETENTANEGDYIVKNQTSSEELYIVPKDRFEERYSFSNTIDEVWDEYRPSGEIKAIQVDQQVLSQLKQQGTFHIYASWDAPQRVEKGDMLVTPLPSCNEIYRIALKAFNETYQLIEPE